MVVHIVIAGKSQCEVFAEICLVANYLCQKLPSFCFERIEKSVLDWPTWLCKVNVKNNWHHVGSPVIWKEVLMKGSKPFYIGGAAEFLEYCHSYYGFDMFMGYEKYQSLVKNFGQYKKKLKQEELSELTNERRDSIEREVKDTLEKNFYTICISGAACPLTKFLVTRFLDMTVKKKFFSKIFLYDENCTGNFLENIETECTYLMSPFPGKVVRYIDKIGNALTVSDVLVILDHVPFDPQMSIGEWLDKNMNLMKHLAVMINASASRSMYIVLANLGPACFNATVLMHSVTTNVKNIVVATSDQGLEILDVLSENTECPMRRMYCPPVWGFVGINHLVDINTTVHKYSMFEPYSRYYKVHNSTLNIGSVTPEMRTMEYLTYFDDTLWIKVAENKKKLSPSNEATLNKAVSLVNLIKVWMLDENPWDNIVNLGLVCDGSFGLTFDGVFSQPARLFGREWRPAKEFFYPKDNFVKLPYLEYIANMMMKLEKTELPPIIPYYPCSCKRDYVKKKGVWGVGSPETLLKLKPNEPIRNISPDIIIVDVDKMEPRKTARRPSLSPKAGSSFGDV